MYVRIYVCMYTYVRMYVCIYVCMYVCMYIYQEQIQESLWGLTTTLSTLADNSKDQCIGIKTHWIIIPTEGLHLPHSLLAIHHNHVSRYKTYVSSCL